MQTFSSGREAKEYIIALIIAEAERDNIPLSETERKMMYFSETAWTLHDIWEVSKVFDRDYDQPTYEAKISELARKAQGRIRDTNEQKKWKDAHNTLESEDHYLLLLLCA